MKRRNTHQKEAILTMVRCTDSHPTADWIYDEVRKILPGISKGTVYRNLRILCDEEEISELKTAGNLSRYEGNLAHHYHFRCENCGCVHDLIEPVDAEMNGRIEQQTGFKVFNHHLEFRGLCRNCQKTKKRRAEF